MTVLRSDAPLILVDAYSTGAFLARSLAEKRPLLHVRSRAAMPPAFASSCPKELFEEDFGLVEMGWEPLLAALAARRPGAVLTGSEFGVELADRLAAALGLAGNDPTSSAARRNKALMVERVALAGLPVAIQQRVDTVKQALDWYARAGQPSVVAKPLDSAGSDNVFICHDREALSAAVTAILGGTNLMMCDNRQALLQEYLIGPEYVVNSVSHAGRHWITDVWRCTKALTAEGRKIYDHEDLLQEEAPELPSLLAYAEGVLDALGIVHGPAHTELILTERGPRLLETGARLSGLACPGALQSATGNDQVALTGLTCLAPAKLTTHPQRYRLQRHARTLSLIAHRAGTFAQSEALARLQALPSFYTARFRFAEGAAIAPTIDLNSSPGAVFLVHSRAEQIEADYRAWRDWERKGL